jgi:cytochrome c-type biogenesis protein CcmE
VVESLSSKHPTELPAEQPARSSRSLPAKLVMAAAVIVAAVAYLVFTAVQTSAVYYMTVSELLATGPSVQGQAVRVAGNVVAGSIQQEQGGLVAHFDAADATGRMPITYRGVLPDIFGDGVEVVVEGRYQDNGVFAASTLFAKCPSKFES